MKKFLLAGASALTIAIPAAALADEGMWLPSQTAAIAEEIAGEEEGIDDAVLAGGQRPGAEALQRIDQHILQIRGLGRLAAHALCVSAAIACRGTNCLFTLHTKHHASPNWTFQLLVLWRFYAPQEKLNRHSIYQLRFH